MPIKNRFESHNLKIAQFFGFVIHHFSWQSRAHYDISRYFSGNRNVLTGRVGEKDLFLMGLGVTRSWVMLCGHRKLNSESRAV